MIKSQLALSKTYIQGQGIDITNGIISNTGVLSVNGQNGNITGIATTNDLTNMYTKAEANNTFATKAEVPTKISQLTNDSQYITKTVDNLTNYYKKTETYTQAEVNNLIGAITTISFQIVDSLPTIGQVNVIYLVPDTQATNNVYDEYIWVNNSWELIGSTSVDLSNYYTKTEADNKFALSADIPTKTSDLTNDSNFQNATQVQALIDTAIANITDGDEVSY